MKPDGSPDVQDVLAQVDTLWPWEKEQLLDKLLTREMLQVKVGQMSIEEINDYTGLYCYDDEQKDPEDLSLDEVMKYHCTTDLIEWLIDKGASMSMLAMLGEKGILKEKNAIVVSDHHLEVLYFACKRLKNPGKLQMVIPGIAKKSIRVSDKDLTDLMARIENTIKKEE